MHEYLRKSKKNEIKEATLKLRNFIFSIIDNFYLALTEYYNIKLLCQISICKILFTRYSIHKKILIISF